MGLDVTIRTARPDEMALVYKSWINTQKDSPVRALMSHRGHDTGLHRLIEQLTTRCTVLVAEYEGIAAGFAAGGWGVVHYVFVKEAYQRKGIARRLVAPFVDGIERVRYSHKPAEWRTITIPSSWVYDPFAAWAPE